MKILVIHNDYQQPGGELLAVNTEVELLRKHDQLVIEYRRNNSEILHYGTQEKASFIASALYSRRTYTAIRQLAATTRPDIAHVHNVFPLISPSIYVALHDAGVPIVQTLHNYRLLCPNALFFTGGKVCERCIHGNTLHAVRWKCYKESQLLSALYALSIGWHRAKRTFGVINRFVALTEFTAKKMVEGGLATPSQITVIGNFIQDPLPAPGSFAGRQPYIVYLGRLAPEKGVDVAIKAMQNLPELRLKIAGDGPIAPALAEMAKDLGLGNVEFLGFVAGDQKWTLLQHATAVVIPSTWYEGLPFAALESLTAGTPIVASRLGSLPYVIEDGKSGLLFEAGNANDLKEKLTWLNNHISAVGSMGQYGRQVAETSYSADAHYEKLMDLYKETLP